MQAPNRRRDPGPSARRSPLLGVVLVTALAVPAARAEPLPYDLACPIIYDNDGAIESGFTDAYVMALASAGVLDLRGIVTTCSYGEAQREPPFAPVAGADVTRERRELVEKARRSGLRNVPDVTAGCSLSLRRPDSGRIEDTVPHDTPASRLILDEARNATPARPLVILMGGQATTVVDAYLLDNTIADRMVLAWIVGNKTPEGGIDSREYNAGVDPWATYIAFERLRVVAFPFSNDGSDINDGFAATPKSRLGELPQTELRQTMLEARWPRSQTTFSEPAFDYDAMPVFPLTRPDYVLGTKRLSFGNWYAAPWEGDPGAQVPAFRDDPMGRTLVVWSGSQEVATDEWWQRMRDPAAWGPAQGRVPFGGAPLLVPDTLEAEHFDHGGTGVAYEDTTNNLSDARWLNPIRFLEHVDILTSEAASGGYRVGRVDAGEWMEYTVEVPHAGDYGLAVSVASLGAGGTFHVEAEGADITGPLAIPDTGGWDKWQTVSRDGLHLEAGVQVLRLVMDSEGPLGCVGDFDTIRLAGSGRDLGMVGAQATDIAAASGTTGSALRVSENGRYLVESDGTPFFWLGDTAWLLFQKTTHEDAELYLKTRAEQGFTVVQAALVMGEERVGGTLVPNAYGDLAFEGGDPSRPRLTNGSAEASAGEYDYWDHVDYIIGRAAAHGLTLGLLPLFVGCGGDGYQYLTPDNAYAYGLFLGERYRHQRHVFWILGGDNTPDTETKQRAWREAARGLATGVTGTEEYSRTLMTYHINGNNSSSQWLHAAPWLDLNMIQVWGSEPDIYPKVLADYKLTPTKPTGLGEGSYEDGPQYGTRPIDALKVREQAYWSYMAGGYHTFGNTNTWNFGTFTGEVTQDWKAALHSPGAASLSVLAKLLGSQKWWELAPDDTVIAAGEGEGATGNRAMRSKSGDCLLVYISSPCTVSLNMGRITATPTARAAWVDPRTGDRTEIGNFAAEGSRGFTLPDGWLDGVLLLDAAK